jgi:hypothetical protein
MNFKKKCYKKVAEQYFLLLQIQQYLHKSQTVAKKIICIYKIKKATLGQILVILIIATKAITRLTTIVTITMKSS